MLAKQHGIKNETAELFTIDYSQMKIISEHISRQCKVTTNCLPRSDCDPVNYITFVFNLIPPLIIFTEMGSNCVEL